MNPTVAQLPEWLESCLESKVAILGAGRSGLGVKALVQSLGGDAVLYDERGGADCASSFDQSAAGGARLVVYSPGFRNDHEWIEQARSAGCRVIPEFDLGGALWKGPIIAVTGTNGKTTLTSFLNEAFTHAGIASYAVGNIGTPLCSLLAEDCNSEAIAICEVSSFQAETLELLRADHVLWTNFDEDHLDRHDSMPSYFRSKYRLVANARGSSLFVDPSVYDYGVRIGLDLPRSAVVEQSATAEELGLRGSVFETRPELNSYLMARSLWLSLKLDENQLVEAAHLFVKAPHRMEFLGEKRGVRFWNDSKATNFHAVMGGLSRFEEPVIWLAGGESKGGDLESFAKRVAPLVRHAALFGAVGSSLKAALGTEGLETSVHDSLEDAVAESFSLSRPGDNVVLSPGFASFDMFENYVQRGEAFRKAVDCL